MSILKKLQPKPTGVPDKKRDPMDSSDLEQRPWAMALKGGPLPEPSPYRGEVTRDAKGRIVLGKTINPYGAYHNVINMIRAITCDGEELVAQAVHVLRGDVSAIAYTKDGTPYEAKPSLADRAEARRWLADRLLGKAPETVKYTEETKAPELNYDALSEEELLALRKLLLKAAPVQKVEIDVTPDKSPGKSDSEAD